MSATTAAPGSPRRLVILGGGVSAITTAFRLTSEPDWQHRYDITLYQMGWRLGGKGASGRNRDLYDRIEEHGIHVWFGFYYNAFAGLRACYDELDRPQDCPIRSLEEAFHPHHGTAFAQQYHRQWHAWALDPPAWPGKVGEGWNPLPVMSAVDAFLDWLLSHLEPDTSEQEDEPPSLWRRLIGKAELTLLDIARINHWKEELRAAKQSLHSTAHSASTEGDDSEEPYQHLIDWLVSLRKHINEFTLAARQLSLRIERLWLLLDFGLTAVIGFLSDQIYRRGFDSVNHLNLIDWLKTHGASKDTLDGPLLASLYGGIFAYQEGDIEKPNVETGTVLRAGLMAVTCAKEAFVWRMNAGMGDVVFAPYYELLKRRGVKFRFFHRVTEIVATQQSDGPALSAIHLVQQVPLREGLSDYDPLFAVKNLPCWPSEPLYEQLDPTVAELLKANHINLESTWSNWPELYKEPEITLRQGEDFDEVILGISVASLPALCPTLMTLSPAFATMTQQIQTVATQAVQLWMNKDIEALGWIGESSKDDAPELLGFDVQAMDSWADVSYLDAVENWPVENTPKDISYFCGVFHPDAAPPAPDPSYPDSQKLKVTTDMIHMMNTSLGDLWTKAVTDGQFDWSVLIAPPSQIGEARFDAQYARANIDPSERYVQSVADTSRYRLTTNGSGISNLYLTGDWIDNGFNMGCVESATWSGLQTARAIIGHDEIIPGEDHLYQDTPPTKASDLGKRPR
ncbi:NAD(P)-binding protein [Pokkaliibacter sp. CJK22405]|uniref:NAD(P)-binding protein n=1 Tax=Pokkaliibacter sp. CJK22405 TaxID=3384615 RepID=UPI003984E72F